MNNFLLIVAIPIFFISCNNNQFKIVSEFVIQEDDSKNKIITTYEVNYDPENINWRKYEDFAMSLVDNNVSNLEIYFFSSIERTPRLDIKNTIIDTNYQSLCLAKYTNILDDSFFKKYPFKVEYGIENIIMNEDSTYNISVYAISPVKIAGYQINLAPTNIFTIESIKEQNKSGEYGFMISNSTNLVLGFSMYSYKIPASTSMKIKDNILYTVIAKCNKHDKIKNTTFYLDAIFADSDAEKIPLYNEPFTFNE